MLIKILLLLNQTTKAITGVQEVVSPLFTLMICLRLGNLILMMWEGKVNPSGVNVQLTSKHWATDKKSNKKNL